MPASRHLSTKPATPEARTSPPRWFVYLLRCADGSLYCGITTDPERRLREHNSGRGARYTRGRRPVTLIYREHLSSRAEAARREAAVKRLRRSAKLALAGQGRQ